MAIFTAKNSFVTHFTFQSLLQPVLKPSHALTALPSSLLPPQFSRNSPNSPDLSGTYFSAQDGTSSVRLWQHGIWPKQGVLLPEKGPFCDDFGFGGPVLYSFAFWSAAQQSEPRPMVLAPLGNLSISPP